MVPQLRLPQSSNGCRGVAQWAICTMPSSFVPTFFDMALLIHPARVRVRVRVRQLSNCKVEVYHELWWSGKMPTITSCVDEKCICVHKLGHHRY